MSAGQLLLGEYEDLPDFCAPKWTGKAFKIEFSLFGRRYMLEFIAAARNGGFDEGGDC